MSEDRYVEGEILPDEDAQGSGLDEFWTNMELPPRPFAEILINLRKRISEELGHTVTQEEFGELLGGISQRTISRWQTGAVSPQDEHLKRIVELAHSYGLTGLSAKRLKLSLERAVSDYQALDPRIRALNAMLEPEDETFKAEFHNVIIAIYYIMRGVRRS